MSSDLSYSQAIPYLLSFADFERSGRFAERPDVAPVLALLGALGDPHLGRPTVHVAGSKGKGSVSAMVESILRAAGLRTGLYTSPHLYSYTERIRINGEPVPEGTFARLAGEVREAAERIAGELAGRSLVTFDLLTALGFLGFRGAGVDAQVIEVGLGGRLDSTNVFKTKEVAVITPISLEHTAILGDMVAAIAREKSGIITPGCTVVLGAQAHPEAQRVICGVAGERAAPVVDVAREYRCEVLQHDLRSQDVRIEGPLGAIEARLPLLGTHQVDNAATAVAAVEALVRAGLRPASTADDIARGLAAVRWPCRFEVVRERPLAIVDGAHNRDSARTFLQALRECAGHERATFVVGASADKDICALAEVLAPAAEAVFAARAQHPRAMEAARIVEAFRDRGVFVEDAGSVLEAVWQALAKTTDGGVICVLGSLFVAAEAREHLVEPRHSPGAAGGR